MDNKIRTMLISPHSDDIAFSLGGSLLQDVFLGPYLMVTIFTKSNYSPCINVIDPEEVTKIRHLEDVKFTDKLQIRFTSFNFSESPLRGYSRRDRFADKNPVTDPIYNDVYNTLSNLIKSNRCELIVSPMGLGNHIDHIIVCNVCCRIAKENNIKIGFYEDLQYASRLALKQIEARAISINPDLRPRKIDITSTFNNKIQNMKLYRTQMSNIILSRIILTMIKYHAIRLDKNKSLKELIFSRNLIKYLIFLSTEKQAQIPLYECIWV